MRYILILNGPNLNLLGRREPEIYGAETLDTIIAGLRERFASIELRHEQHNGEGSLIDTLHTAGFDSECLGIVFNAGAYTHYSYAIADAVSAINLPVVEVHISQPAGREEFRRKSVIAPVCMASVSGFGLDSYYLAIEGLLRTRL